jgi:hypothetical protein
MSADGSTGTRRVADVDRLAELEEERAFLLRSLDDLERELAAGDVDETDYAVLRDDYTVRAARVLREIEAGRTALPARRPTNWRSVGSIVVVSVLACVLIGWALSRSTGARDAGDTLSGVELDGGINDLLVEARQLQPTDPLGAIQRYDAVLEQDPSNVEALTYRGWTSAFVALGLPEGEQRGVLVESATEFLDRARAADPTYADAQCFTAIVRFRFQNDAAGAAEPLERCREGDLPSSVQGLLDALGAQIDEALAATPTSPSTSTP